MLRYSYFKSFSKNTVTEVAKTYFGTRESPKAVFGANVFKTTNDNVSDWLTTELDYSAKDNESGIYFFT